MLVSIGWSSASSVSTSASALAVHGSASAAVGFEELDLVGLLYQAESVVEDVPQLGAKLGAVLAILTEAGWTRLRPTFQLACHHVQRQGGWYGLEQNHE